MKGIALLIILTVAVVCPLGILIGASVSGPVLFDQYHRFFSSDLYGQMLQRTVLVSALTVAGPIVARVACGDGISKRTISPLNRQSMLMIDLQLNPKPGDDNDLRTASL